MTELKNARVLVVGASGGLGAPISRALSAAGAALTLAGRSEEKLDEVGITDAYLSTADLRGPDAGQSLINDALEHHGGLDGVIIAAGIVAFGPAVELDDDDADDLLLVNLLAPIRIMRAALPVIAPGGFILNISAVVADKPMPNMAAYSASKAAVSAFAKSVRTEARRAKIRIIDVRPPHTETGLANHPIAGSAPKLPQGLAPDAVADRIVAAIVNDETDLGADAFLL